MPTISVGDSDLEADIISIKQQVSSLEKELWRLQRAAEEACPYNKGERYLCELEDGTKEIGQVSSIECFVDHGKLTKASIAVRFNKVKKDNTVSSHRLYNVVTILQKQ